MSQTGLDVFDTTVQKTNNWLNDVMEELSTQDRHSSYIALRATLHALRDQLPVEEVAQLGAQFPMLIRGFFYEGWDPSGMPIRDRHREQFLARIKTEFGSATTADPEELARAVFRVLSHRVTQGEIDDVKVILPAAIRSLWP